MPKHNLILAIFLLFGFVIAMLALQVVRHDEVLSTTMHYLIEDATSEYGSRNLMLGSSTIKRLETQDVFNCGPWLNRGIGSSKISSLNRYVKFSQLVVEPSVVLVYAGENDLSSGMHRSEVFDQFRALIQQLVEKFPFSEIHILAIKPSPSRRAHWESFKAVNAMMQTYVRELQGITFHPTPLPEKEFVEIGFLDDGIHLTGQGYNLFTSGFNEVCVTL